MLRTSRTLVALTALTALGALTAADAQKPTPPTPPKPPVVKPATTVKPPSAPATGGITIICKDFGFGQMPGALPYRDSRVTYETVTVKDASGVMRTIYAPTRIIVSQEFKAATARIDSDGRGLVTGECGTPNAVIAGMTGPATLQFNNFPSVFVQVSKKNAGDTQMQAMVNLPPCASGLRSFRTIRQNPNEFFISQPADATCLN
ncbi:MAG: hypothetical protein ABMA14_16520 [Hyphomonadaceae bacterium]